MMLPVIPFVLFAPLIARASPLYRRDSNSPSVLESYGDWMDVGCYVDSVDARVLPTLMQTVGGSAALMVETCLDACQASGYEYAGLEYGGECFCGGEIPIEVATDGRCDMVCNGSGLEYCGGSNGLEVYMFTGASPTNTTIPSNNATTLESYNNWVDVGCYADSVDFRSLPIVMSIPDGPDGMTVEKCLDTCTSHGYPFAGLEYGQECYCGEDLPLTELDDDACNMPCKGNTLEFCGGPNSLDVYVFNSTQPTTTASDSDLPTTTAATTTASQSCATTYTVPTDSTCDSVAALFGISSSDIFNANTFVDCADIWQWTSLCIPSINNSNPSAPAPASSPRCVQMYTSVDGDTCDSIGETNGITGAAILDANSFLDCWNIWPWTPICIPDTSECTQTIWSQPGDTCESIAEDNGTDAAHILEWNSFLSCENIWNNTPVCVSHT